MGWGRTLLLGDVGNRMDIGDCEYEIRKIKKGLGTSYHKDASQDQKIEALQKENSELKLYVAALARILMAKNVVTRGNSKGSDAKFKNRNPDTDLSDFILQTAANS